MLKKKKTTASGELVAVKSVRKNAQPQIENLCSKGGLGDFPQQARGAIWIATGIACRSLRKSKSVMLQYEVIALFYSSKRTIMMCVEG